jgi:hypothetical protein
MLTIQWSGLLLLAALIQRRAFAFLKASVASLSWLVAASRMWFFDRSCAAVCETVATKTWMMDVFHLFLPETTSRQQTGHAIFIKWQ